MTVDRAPRRRRRPEEAERAILSAARSFFEKRPFRELTVERVMARTGLSRPAFYTYFRDRYDLVARLLEGIGGLLFAVDRRWLIDRKSTRLNSSHANISYAVFCFKKKKKRLSK